MILEAYGGTMLTAAQEYFRHGNGDRDLGD